MRGDEQTGLIDNGRMIVQLAAAILEGDAHVSEARVDHLATEDTPGALLAARQLIRVARVAHGQVLAGHVEHRGRRLEAHAAGAREGSGLIQLRLHRRQLRVRCRAAVAL